MNEPNERISAKRFDAVSAELESISATPEDSRYIGLETACLEAIDHLLTAMFPYHIGKAGSFLLTAIQYSYKYP